MNTKKKMTVARFLSGALVLLGFGSCSNASDDEGGGRLEYGTPTVDFQIKGKVTSEEGDPLKGIQVIVRHAWDNRPEGGADTLYTDAKGEFSGKELTVGAIAEQKAYFNDVDGEANGGAFKSDSVALKNMDNKKVGDGNGHWYNGKYELSTTVKLKKADKK